MLSAQGFCPLIWAHPRLKKHPDTCACTSRPVIPAISGVVSSAWEQASKFQGLRWQWPWHAQAFLSHPGSWEAQHQYQTKAIFRPGINCHFRVSISHLCFENPRIADQSAQGFRKVLNVYKSRPSFVNLIKVLKCVYYDLHVFLGGSLTLLEFIQATSPKLQLWLSITCVCTRVPLHIDIKFDLNTKRNILN